MLERITRVTEAFFADVEDGSLVQEQREALIDLLIWTMLVDNQIDTAENNHLDGMLERLDWQSPYQLQQYLGMAYARVRSALPPRDPADLLGSIHRRLGSSEMRRRAFRFAADLAEADGQRSPAEIAFLNHVAEAFGRD